MVHSASTPHRTGSPPLKRKRTVSSTQEEPESGSRYLYSPPPASLAPPTTHLSSGRSAAAVGTYNDSSTRSAPNTLATSSAQQQPPATALAHPAYQQQQYQHFPPHPPPHLTYPGAMSTNGPRPPQQQYTTDTRSLSPSAEVALPPLSLSILGVEPLDEFIKEVADFVHHMITTRRLEYEHLGGVVEVEAKIGLLRDRAGQRLSLPVLVESILTPDSVDVRFESNMSVSQHKHFNALLNNLKTTPANTPVSTPLDYSHLHLVDNFYTPSGASESRDKIRVTRDETTNTVVQCVKKIRLGDLNIYSPKRSSDWRVSVNLEVPFSHPIGSPTYTRRKDRMRYTHEEFVIDLTQVTTHTLPTAPPQQTLHELELEIARPELLLATASKRNDVSVSEHERSAFDELIRAFVNNARILVRNSSDGWQ